MAPSFGRSEKSELAIPWWLETSVSDLQIHTKKDLMAKLGELIPKPGPYGGSDAGLGSFEVPCRPKNQLSCRFRYQNPQNPSHLPVYLSIFPSIDATLKGSG